VTEIDDRDYRRTAIRVLKSLGREAAAVTPGPGGGANGSAVLGLGDSRTLSVPSAQLKRMAAEDLLQRDGGGGDGDCRRRVKATEAGLNWLRRALAAGPEDGFQAQHQERVSKTFADGAGRSASVTVNLAESPLAWLSRRRARDGNALLEPEQIAAGERLRADFSRAQMSPRVTANWEARAGGRGSGGGGRSPGLIDLTDAALDARQRVHRALDDVGPELGSVLLDVCCFLKGLEVTERDHGWPARTGKVVLKIALDRLAGHYGLRARPGRRRSGVLEHWGADDFRPRADGDAPSAAPPAAPPEV
jgi:hypothetical protein